MLPDPDRCASANKVPQPVPVDLDSNGHFDRADLPACASTHSDSRIVEQVHRTESLYLCENSAQRRPRRTLSLGEVKWGEVMGGHHVERLARARDLLSSSHDTATATSPATLRPDSTMISGRPGTRLALIALDDIYA
jgi:hypothetical protein